MARKSGVLALALVGLACGIPAESPQSLDQESMEVFHPDDRWQPALTLGPRTALVLPVEFLNTPSTHSRVPRSTIVAATQGAAPSLATYLSEVSAGQSTLNATVANWMVLDINKPSGNSVGTINMVRSAALAKAAALGMVTTGFQHILIFGDVPASVAYQDTALVQDHPAGGFPTTVFIHEFGHTLGLGHANRVACLGGGAGLSLESCGSVEYGDYLDVMGGGIGQAPHFSAPVKERLGFLTGGALLDVTISGSYTLVPHETSGAGIRALRIPRGIHAPNGSELWLEYRQPIGYDATLSQTKGAPDFVPKETRVFEGALFHVDRRLLDATPEDGDWTRPALGVGQTLTDPATGTRVAVVNNLRNLAQPHLSRLTVNITLGKQDLEPPVVQFLSPAAETTVTGPFDVEFELQDASQPLLLGVTVAGVPFTGSVLAVAPNRYRFHVPAESLVGGTMVIHVTSRDRACAGIEGCALDNTGSATWTVTYQPPDLAAPVVKILQPLPTGWSGMQWVNVQAGDDVGVTLVDLLVDGATVQSQPGMGFMPWMVPWGMMGYGFELDTTGYANGVHTVRGRAWDAALRSTRTPSLKVAVSNPPDVEPPSVSITAPSTGSTQTTTFTVTATAADAIGVQRVEFYVRGVRRCSDVSAPYSCRVSFSALAAGNNTVEARALDYFGNPASSSIVVVR